MKKCLFILAILFSGNLPNFAQKAKIDSILANLGEIRKNDSIYYFGYSADLIEYYRNINIDSSNNFINEFLKISKRNKWIGSEVFLLGQLAFNANLQGNQFLAIEYNYKALQMAEKAKRFELIPQIQLVLGESYMHLKQFEKARELLSSALKNARLLKQTYEETSCLTDLGNLELEIKNFKNAEKYYLEAFERLKNDPYPLAKGIAYQNLAMAIARQNRFSEALKLFKKSLEILINDRQNYQISNVYNDIADLYFNQKNYSKSIENANLAIKYSTISNSPEIISKANNWLYQNYSMLNLKEMALYHYEKYINLKDSLNKEDFAKRINSMQFEYENSQKTLKIAEQKNDILARENENLSLQKTKNLILIGAIFSILLAVFLYRNRQQLKKTNEKLEQKVQERTAEITEVNLTLLQKNQEISNALFKGQTIERKRVASELHDHLSSLLSAVKMSIQAIKTDNLNEAERKIIGGVKEMTNMAYNEVRNISHNILPDDLEAKGLIITIQQFIEKLNLSGKIYFEVTTNTTAKFEQKIELNLYSILLELINNIIKHSEATEAKINIQVVDNKIEISVIDNGIGFTNIVASGAGTSNIVARVEALNGNYNINSNEKIGTKINISVPI